MAVIASQKIIEKLASKHGVNINEVHQCFANRTGKLLFDLREKHDTDPKTLWFIAETDYGRKLKIVFVPKNGDIYLRTAYPPNSEESGIYKKANGGN